MGLSGTEPDRTFPLQTLNEKGEVEVVQREPVTYPRMLTLARYPEPGILVGRSPTADIQFERILGANTEDVAEMQEKYGGLGFRSTEFHPMMFCRLLAKTAHAAGAAIVRSENFEPLLWDMIKTPDEKPFYLVGGGLETLQPQEVGVLHWIRLGWEGKFLVASIRLFALFGTPIYRVVVGYRPQEQPARSDPDSNRRDIEILFKLAE
jgi:hypothetical protein